MQTIYDDTQITSKQNGHNPKPGGPSTPLTKSGRAPLLVETDIQPKPLHERVWDNSGGGIAGTLKKQYNDNSTHIVQMEEQKNIEDGNNRIADTLTIGANQTTRRPGDIALQDKVIVRRLTPLECERLQGFPDRYTDIPGATDSKRYAALGNSMTVQVMAWIGKRIQIVDDCLKELEEAKKQNS